MPCRRGGLPVPTPRASVPLGAVGMRRAESTAGALRVSLESDALAEGAVRTRAVELSVGRCQVGAGESRRGVAVLLLGRGSTES